MKVLEPPPLKVNGVAPETLSVPFCDPVARVKIGPKSGTVTKGFSLVLPIDLVV